MFQPSSQVCRHARHVGSLIVGSQEPQRGKVWLGQPQELVTPAAQVHDALHTPRQEAFLLRRRIEIHPLPFFSKTGCLIY